MVDYAQSDESGGRVDRGPESAGTPHPPPSNKLMKRYYSILRRRIISFSMRLGNKGTGVCMRLAFERGISNTRIYNRINYQYRREKLSVQERDNYNVNMNEQMIAVRTCHCTSKETMLGKNPSCKRKFGNSSSNLLAF